MNLIMISSWNYFTHEMHIHFDYVYRKGIGWFLSLLISLDFVSSIMVIFWRQILKSLSIQSLASDFSNFALDKSFSFLEPLFWKISIARVLIS